MSACLIDAVCTACVTAGCHFAKLGTGETHCVDDKDDLFDGEIEFVVQPGVEMYCPDAPKQNPPSSLTSTLSPKASSEIDISTTTTTITDFLMGMLNGCFIY
jgi:hypothetical protein